VTASKLAMQGLTTPRIAAVAGVIFSVLMSASLVIIRLAASKAAAGQEEWLNGVQLAVDMVPFAGIAFLWFVGVLRDQLGEREDKFFATVFLGSGLIFVATMFGSAAALTSAVESVTAGPAGSPNTETYDFGLRMSSLLMNVFAMKMAAVFTFSTCAMGFRTGFLPRWLALLGFVCGGVLVLVMKNWLWIALLFPMWVLSVSLWILSGKWRDAVVEQRS
jgi:hypothetical protein